MSRCQRRRPPLRRAARWLLAIAATALALGACAGQPASPSAPSASGTAAPPPDPAARGPYAVGVTRRSLTRPSTTTGEPRLLDTAIWYPATPAAAALPRDERLAAAVDAEPERAGRPYPVVVHSAGTGATPAVHTYLAVHLASHGFVFVGLSHSGTTPAPCPYQPCLSSNPEAAAWLAEASANRLDDVRFMVEAVLGMNVGGDGLLAGLLDPARLGLAGSSAGGGTAIQIVAEDPRFRALVGLATAGDRSAALAAAPRVAVPALFFAGGLDHLATPPWQESLFAAFAASGPERWFAVIPRSGHNMVIDWCPDGYVGCAPEGLTQDEAHARINRWAAAFLGRYVAGDERYAPLLDPALADSDPEIQITVARAP